MQRKKRYMQKYLILMLTIIIKKFSETILPEVTSGAQSFQQHFQLTDAKKWQQEKR